MKRKWSAPGPGLWELDAANFPHPLTAAAQELLPDALEDGFARGCRRYGVAIETLRVGLVNARVYEQIVPVGVDQLEERPDTAERTLARRQWLQDSEQWYRSGRAALTTRLLALQDEPIDEYDDDALAGHIDRVATVARDGFAQHMELHLADMIPFGRVLLVCRSLDIPDELPVAAMIGASPSSGTSALLDDAIVAASLKGAEPRTLDDIRALGAGASRSLDSYLRIARHRAISTWDISSATVGEQRTLVFDMILTEVQRRSSPRSAIQADAVERLRQAVVPSERDRFETLINDSLLTFGLRDDNAGPTMMWPIGLLRRAFTEAGVRRPSSLVREASVTEALAILRGANEPGDDELERRAVTRAGAANATAPAVLGRDAQPTTEAALPAAVAELTNALLAYFSLLGASGASEPLFGTGIGSHPHIGPACVASTPEDAVTRCAPGAVLVVTTTAPAYDPALTLAAAIVTETGGPLSHAAMVARELNIAAVIGAPTATTAISDGDLIEVDPIAGRVRILRRP